MKHHRSIRGLVWLALAGLLIPQLVFGAPLPNAWQITDSSSENGSVFAYINQLDAPQRAAATNHGFRFSVNARFVTNFAGAGKTITMHYGLGSRRYLIYFNLENDDLTAELENGPTYTLTTNGTGRALYHTHEIVYNPTNSTASYVFNGQVKTNGWLSSDPDSPAGRITWGAGSSFGQGQMNFHSIKFEITNTVVASYDAGVAGGPVPNLDPVSQGWFPSPSNPGLVGTNAISPDVALLPVTTTLAADQFITNSARLNGQANPRGSPAMAWFEWGATLAYGNSTAPQPLGSGISPVSLSNVIGSLVVGTDYHFRLVASNEFGVVAGANRSFNLGFIQTTVAGLQGVNETAAWGDYDNDGRLDFLIMGPPGMGPYYNPPQLWQNTGSGFTNVTDSVAPVLPGVGLSSISWGDYDNDGRLDFLLTGDRAASPSISQLWRNTGGGFSNVTDHVAAGLAEVSFGFTAWGDYDNDGRLDFLLTGDPWNGPLVSQLWRNTGNAFSNVTATVAPALPGVDSSSVAWGDYDNDGRLDFLLTGDGGMTNVSQLWRNTGIGFSNVTATVAPGLPGVYGSSIAWGDYDNDGHLDFLLTGFTGSSRVSQLWRNTGIGFSNVTATVAPGLPGVNASSIAWGDYDNDGRLDFLLTGYNGSSGVSQLWRNTGNGFTNVPLAALPGASSGSIGWADYDKDGRLDFLLTGNNGSSDFAQLWRNNLPVSSNAPPAAPAGLSATVSGSTVALTWNAPADDHTPGAGLSYNVRIGSTAGASDVLSPMALTNGLRLVPARGNAQTTNAIYSLSTPGRTYYWSVQAVDTGFAGSLFAAEAQFTVGPLLINPIRFSSGIFEFYFTNQSVLNFETLASTNLALPLPGWINLGPAIPLDGGIYRFTDTLAPGQPKRFYQLRAQ